MGKIKLFFTRCLQCKGPLITRKEKIIRTCDKCARLAKQGFEKMGQGKFKEGISDVLDVRLGKGNSIEKDILKEKMRKGLSRKRQKIIKKLKKQGLTDQEIEEGLAEWDKGI